LETIEFGVDFFKKSLDMDKSKLPKLLIDFECYYDYWFWTLQKWNLELVLYKRSMNVKY
jgi:hypothetical protein